MKEPDIRAFTQWVINESRDCLDLNGGDLQEAAVRCGVLIEHEVYESCGEGCVCDEVGDWPLYCYRLHPSLAEPPAGREVVDG